MPKKSVGEQYASRGINYVYNQRNHKIYLSILNAPYCDPTYKGDGCKLTGHLIPDTRIETIKNIDFWVNKVKHDYCIEYAGNTEMLKYAETVN